PDFSPGLVKANFCRAPQCHAALFWTDLVLHNVSSVFSLSAIADPQPEARHAIVELNMVEFAHGQLEFGDIGLGELHRRPQLGKTLGSFLSSSRVFPRAV